MKKARLAYLTVGFIAGIAYIVSCGGSSSSIAQTVVDAINVVYDNAVSSLTATTAQGAIDELATNAQDYQTKTLTTDMVMGGWTGQHFYNNLQRSNMTLQLNSDFSYSCVPGWFAGSALAEYCSDPDYLWGVAGRVIFLGKEGSDSDWHIIYVDYVDENKISLLVSLANKDQFEYFHGTKVQ